MFDYCQPTRIHFGAGRICEIGAVCRRYGTVCLMVTTPDEPLRPLYEKIKGLLAKLLDVLPFGSREELETILRESYE